MQRHKYYFLGGKFLRKAISVDLAMEHLYKKIQAEEVDDVDTAHDLYDHLQQRRNFYTDVANAMASFANCRIKDVDAIEDSESEIILDRLTESLANFNAQAEADGVES